MAQSVGSVSVDVVPDAGRFRRELDAKLKGLKANIGLEADVAKLRAKIQAATKNKARMTVHVDANMSKFNAKIKRALKARQLTLNVDLDAGTAEAELDAVARDRTVNIDADTGAATAQIAALDRAAGGAGRGLRGLVVAAVALGPALVPVTAAVGGLVAALSAPLAAAGGGISSLAASIVGNVKDVMDAQKDLSAAQDKAKTSAKSYESAQNGVASAMDGVRNAQRGLADAQISSNRGIQAALESVAQARRDAARSEQSARVAVASAVQSANQSVQSAESSLASAQDRARSAQESLNDARDAARQKLADYAAQLRGAALDESGAQLAVRQAQQSLNEILADPKATQLQIDLARQALKEARFNYTQTKKDRADLRKQAAEDRKAGIKGDEGVIDARNELADANREVRDAEREVARTRVQAEKDIAAARKGVVQARVDGAREVAKAEASVEQARVDGARAVAAAQAGVSSANRQLAVAQAAAAAAGTELSEAQSGIAKAMDRLSDGPAQRFVGALDRAKTAWKQFLSATRGKALGVASTALGIFSDLLPKLAPLANAAADAVGDLLGRFGAFVRGGGADKVIDWLTKATGPAIRSLGTIFGNIAVGLGGLIAAFKPLGDALLGSLEKLTDRFAKFGKTADSNSGVKGFMAYVREVGPKVARFFGDIVDIAIELGKGLAPLGEAILDVTHGFAKLLKVVPTPAITGAWVALTAALVAYKVAALRAAVAAKGLSMIRFAALGVGVWLLADAFGGLKKNTGAADHTMGTLKTTLGGLMAGFAVGGPWGAAIGGFVGLFVGLTDAAYDATDGFRAMHGQIDGMVDKLGGSDSPAGSKLFAFNKFIEWGTKKLLGNSSATDKNTRKKRLSISSVDELTSSLRKQNGAITENTRRIILKDFAEKGGLRITKAAGVSVGIVTKALNGNSKAQKFLFQRLNNTNGQTASQREAMKKLWPMIHASNTELRTAQNRQQNLAEAQRKGKKPMSELRKETERNTRKNNRLANSVRDIPANPTIAYQSTGFQKVMREAGSLAGAIQDISDEFVNLFAGARGGKGKPRTGNVPNRASGGPISGPGTSTSDSIPAMLSNGEYVINAKSVDKYGMGLFAALNAGKAKVGGVARYAKGGLVGGFSKSTGGNRGLVEQLASLVRVLRKQVVPALLGDSDRGGRDGTSDPAPRVHVRNNKKMLEPFKKGTKTLEGFQKGLKRTRSATIGMELATGKSAKKMGRYWTVLRKGSVKHWSKDWDRKTRKAENDTKRLDKRTARSSERMGRTLRGFRTGALKSFSSDWKTRFVKQAPADLGQWRSKSTDHFQGTRKNMSNIWRNGIRPVMTDFGQYPRKHVAPAFGKGVDAIGGQWDRVSNRMKRPVRFAVETVLNKGLLAAFNKIAKFVDTDTIKKIQLPKGFAQGGWTGPGGKYDPAGIVHADEYVVSKASRKKVERSTPGLLDYINRTGSVYGYPKVGDGVPVDGYAQGGRVGSPGAIGDKVREKFQKGLDFAKRASNIPGQHYSWGGVGPVGYDCSGFMSAITNVIRGGNPYSRIGATGSMPWPGFRTSSPSLFNLGWFTGSPGHTAGTLLGTNVESSGGVGPHYGPSARGAGDPMFNGHMSLGPEGIGGNWGSNYNMPVLPAWAQKIVEGPKKWARKLLDGGSRLAGGFGGTVQTLLNTLIGPSADWATSQLQAAGGGLGSTGVAAGAAQAYAKKRLRAFGWSQDQFSPLKQLWDHESGWDHTANNPRSSAYGIPQGLVDLHNIPKPYWGRRLGGQDASADFAGGDPGTQVDWGLKYIKDAYGSPANAWASWSRGGGYDFGGLARGVGLMEKWTPRPERVLSPRQTVAFERWMDRDSRGAAGSGGPQQIVGTLDISPNGQATIRGWAAQEMGSAQSYDRTVHRMGTR